MEKYKQPKLHCINKMEEGSDRLTEGRTITIFRNPWLFFPSPTDAREEREAFRLERG